MKCYLEKVFIYSFCLLCAFVTIGLCIYWLYRFGLNEELSVIHYARYHTSNNDIFPTASLCFKNPFITKRLVEYGSNYTAYYGYLAGDIYSEELMKINFSYVTIDLIDYIKDYKIYFQNATSVQGADSKLSQELKKTLAYRSFNGFFSWNSAFYKCFALNVLQDKEVNSFRILISNDIFPNGLRQKQLQARIHLPQHFLLSEFSNRWEWPDQLQTSKYKTRVFLRTMDIVVSRNKRNEECNKQWKNYDKWVIEMHTSEVGCNTPYQVYHDEYENCDTQEKMLQAKLYQDIVSRKNSIRPCRTMRNIHLDWLESNYEDGNHNETGEFWFGIHFPTHTFKQIIQTR